MHTYENSVKAFKEAVNLMPGGVNSPVRAFKSVNAEPIFIESGEGAIIRDIDGNEYIDYVLSWGPLILGHSHPEVVKAIQEQAAKGTSFGAPTVLENKLAQIVIERVPSVEMVRFVSSGTEATMAALRLARGYTGRNIIMKFEGSYHGHGDSLLIKAGSGVATLGKPGFLEGLREITKQYGALLIFDEVMTGFRVDYHCAQGYYGIDPDLTCLGKVVGGGLPVGAYAGKREIMEKVAPSGPVYQAGTLSGNPLAMTAGIETLSRLTPESYDYFKKLGDQLEAGIREAATKYNIPHTINRAGSMIGLFLTNEDVVDFKSAQTSDLTLFAEFYRLMLEEGIYLPPSQFEGLFISTAHTEEHIAKTVDAFHKVFAKLAR